MIPDALTDGPRFAAFCETYTQHTKGRWSGRPFKLEQWQREFWWEALELDPVSGRRVYQECGFGIPTKNGKSAQASAAGLYFLTSDGEAEPEVYVGASHRGQAGIVLGQSRSMALRSNRLRQHVRVLAHRIECPRNGGLMRALSSDGVQQHGLNPSCNIIDEVHAHRTTDLYTAMTKSGGAREQPFTLWITTAGGDEDSLLATLYAQIIDGPGEVERRDSLLIYRDRMNGVLIYWYGAPRDADPDDPAVWLACNPASWLQDGRVLALEHGKLKARGAMLEWRMYHLNQFVASAEQWLPEGAWQRCEGAPVLNAALPVGVGIYKTPNSDAAAVCVAQRQDDRCVVKLRTFDANAVTGRVDTERIRVYLRELRDAFPAPMTRDDKTNRPIKGPSFGFDKWTFNESAEELEQEGLNMIDFPQYASTMGPASTQAYELITTQRLVHERDETLDAHVAASTAILTDRGMKVMVQKKASARRNHGCIALVMASWLAMQEAPRPFVSKPRVGVGY